MASSAKNAGAGSGPAPSDERLFLRLRRGEPGTIGTKEEIVTLAKPGGEKDITYFSAVGPLRFVEGKAHGVPLSVARKLADGRPGWTIEPAPRLGRKVGR